MRCRTGNEFRNSLTVSFIIYSSNLLKPSENYGSTSWIISEENETLSNIFGHPMNSANRAVLKLIFGNLPSSTKRASSVIWENQTLLNTDLRKSDSSTVKACSEYLRKCNIKSNSVQEVSIWKSD